MKTQDFANSVPAMSAGRPPFMGVLERRMLRADAEMERFWAEWKETREEEAMEGYTRCLHRGNRLRQRMADCLLARVDETISRCEWMGGAA